MEKLVAEVYEEGLLDGTTSLPVDADTYPRETTTMQPLETTAKVVSLL